MCFILMSVLHDSDLEDMSLHITSFKSDMCSCVFLHTQGESAFLLLCSLCHKTSAHFYQIQHLQPDQVRRKSLSEGEMMKRKEFFFISLLSNYAILIVSFTNPEIMINKLK